MFPGTTVMMTSVTNKLGGGGVRKELLHVCLRERICSEKIYDGVVPNKFERT